MNLNLATNNNNYTYCCGDNNNNDITIESHFFS